MILAVSVFVIGLVILIVICLPIKIGFKTSTRTITIRYMFVLALIKLLGDKPKIRIYILGRPCKIQAEKKSAKKKKKIQAEKKSAKKKKRIKKVTPQLIIDILRQPSIPKITKVLVKFGFRSLFAVNIKRLNWDIGLKDYYLQGIVHGVSACIPQSKAITINNNYQGCNRLQLKMHIPIWRLLIALVLLLCCFPYLKTFQLYKSTLH